MRTRRAELTWTVAGLGLMMMSFVVVAEHWEAPASVVWTVVPLLFIAAAVVLTWLRVNTIGNAVGGALEEVRRISVAASNAQLKTDERVAALGVRVVDMANHQTAMVAILRRTYPAAEEEPTQPGKRPGRAVLLAHEAADPEQFKRTQKQSRGKPSALVRPQLPAPEDDLGREEDDDPTRVYRAGDLDFGGSGDAAGGDDGEAPPD